MKNITTKKINTGIYEITREGRTFQAEQVEDGQWQIGEFVYNKYSEQTDYEYMEHYVTLKSCKILINDYFNEL